jgi:hypothetical protein
MFSIKGVAYPRVEHLKAPLRCSTLGAIPTNIRLDRVKSSTLLQTFVSYGRKIYNIGLIVNVVKHFLLH